MGASKTRTEDEGAWKAGGETWGRGGVPSVGRVGGGGVAHPTGRGLASRL